MFGKNVFDLLAGIAVFRGLTGDDLKSMAKKSRKLSFRERDILVQEGKVESAFYILVKGSLKVFLPKKMDDNEERRISSVSLNVLKEGDYFGEYSLIDRKPASASVIAVEPGQLIKIEGADFQEILDKDQRIARTVYENMLRTLIQRLRGKDKELDLITIIG